MSFLPLESRVIAADSLDVIPSHGGSSPPHHRRGYSDTWAFLGAPSHSTLPERPTWKGPEGQANLPLPEIHGMDIDSLEAEHPQLPPLICHPLSWQDNPHLGHGASGSDLSFHSTGIDFNQSSHSSRAPHSHPDLSRFSLPLPLPTALRGLGEGGRLPELPPPLTFDGLPSLQAPEDYGQDTHTRLLEGLDLPAPPPPPTSIGGLQPTFSSPANLLGKAGGPSAKLRVQKNTSMKRASTGMNGRSDQELMMLDPKNVRRILANRQSAAKTKERRMQHANELEHKLAAAQEEYDSVANHVEELRVDNNTLTQYNDELVATVPQLQTQLQQLANSSKLLVQEILHAQRLLGLPLMLPDASLLEDRKDTLLPFPRLLQPLGPNHEGV